MYQSLSWSRAVENDLCSPWSYYYLSSSSKDWGWNCFHSAFQVVSLLSEGPLGFASLFAAAGFWQQGRLKFLREGFAAGRGILCVAERSFAGGIFASSFAVTVTKLRDIERFFVICVLSALSLVTLLILELFESMHLSFQVSSFSVIIYQRHSCNRKVSWLETC